MVSCTCDEEFDSFSCRFATMSRVKQHGGCRIASPAWATRALLRSDSGAGQGSRGTSATLAGNRACCRSSAAARRFGVGPHLITEASSMTFWRYFRFWDDGRSGSIKLSIIATMSRKLPILCAFTIKSILWWRFWCKNDKESDENQPFGAEFVAPLCYVYLWNPGFLRNRSRISCASCPNTVHKTWCHFVQPINLGFPGFSSLISGNNMPYLEFAYHVTVFNIHSLADARRFVVGSKRGTLECIRLPSATTWSAET